MVLPTITSVTPATGTIAGGTSIAVVGTGFSVGTPVFTFGTLPVYTFVVNSDTSATLASPVSPDGIAITNVIVTTTAGSSTATAANQFLYVQIPSFPTYGVENPFFNPAANYTFFGVITLAQPPVFAGGGGGGGGVTGAANLGSGEGIFASLSGSTLDFKSLIAGTGITLTPTGTDITISGTSAGSWLTSGNNEAGPYTFGTNGTSGYQFVVGGAQWLNITDTGNLSISVEHLDIDAGETVTFGESATSMAIANSSCPVTLECTVLNIPNLPSSVTSLALYFDSSTGQITQGTAGGGGGGWATDGSNTGTLKFGTAAASGVGWTYQANGTTFATVTSAGGTTWTGAAQFNGTFGVNSPVPVSIIAADNVVIQANDDSTLTVFSDRNTTFNTNDSIVFNPAHHFDVTGGSGSIDLSTGTSIILDAPLLTITSIGTGTTANILYIDTSTGHVTIGAVPGGGSGWAVDGSNSGSGLIFGTNSANGWTYQADSVSFATVDSSGNTTWSGGGQFDGTFGVNATGTTSIISASTFDLTATTGNLHILASDGDLEGAGNNVSFSGTDVSLTASTGASIISSVTSSVDAPTVDIGTTTSTEVNIATSGGALNLIATTITAANLPSASKTNVVYFDPSTQELSQGTFSGSGWGFSGNTLSGTEKIGSLNNEPFTVITDNTTTLVIDGSRNWTTTTADFTNNVTGTFSVSASNLITLSSTSSLLLNSDADASLEGITTLLLLAGTTARLDGATLVEIGNLNAPTVAIGRTSGNTIELISPDIQLTNLPGSAPVGSVAVLWDPVGLRLYHT